MRRLLLPVLLAALALPLGVTAPASAADPDVPRVQTVGDPRGDVRGAAPAGVRRSMDVTRFRLSREVNALLLRFSIGDVRRSGSWRQGATIALVRPVLTQRFTVVGSRVLRADPSAGRVCEDATVTRSARRDTIQVELPFSCIRTTPGRALELRAAVTATDGAGGLATDRVRALRANPR